MTASFAAALISSQVRLFAESSVYIIGAVFVALLAIAVSFPRAVGFPLILLSGVAAVWAGFSFLRYPVPNPSVPVASYTREEIGSDLEVVYTRLRAPRSYPLIGGETRGIVTAAKTGALPGIAVDYLRITVPASRSSGMISVYIEDDELVIK
ncbi:hypothetical protein TREAZ_1447 [Leadbettera azotonutricia ZAS-9]|uniref:Uncharacterized protein n=2 Tax=Leadbettera azotonutricia TaxID=150829 RepID=F5YER3_LEAAZ|nr:hypothetical protein TREAZ_1447 [Leadbettera azotonutricia ZAS-9]